MELSSCKRHPEPAQAVGSEHWDRLYSAFIDKEVTPLAKRDGLIHTSSGCESSATDLLCVECYSRGGEAWVRCDAGGCMMANTNDELNAIGADVGVCERWEAKSGLSVSFTRRAH